MWTLLAHNLWTLASTNPTKLASKLSNKPRYRARTSTHHNSQNKPLIKPAILRLCRNRIQNPVELFPARIRNARIPESVAGNIDHHFVGFPPAKKNISTRSHRTIKHPRRRGRGKIYSHAIKIHPLLHPGPAIASVAVVEVVSVVAGVDGAAVGEGFGRGGVAG
jgi:hypothetical protein